MRLVVQIMSDTVSTSESEEESLEIMQDVKGQIASFLPLIAGLEKQIVSIHERAGTAKPNLLADAVLIQTPSVAEWFGKETTTVAEFTRAILERGTVKTDLETRSLWLQPAIASLLEMPKSQISFFDLLRAMPRLLSLA